MSEDTIPETKKSQCIFISFLGTGNYKECIYVFPNNTESEKVKFIQSATAKKAQCDKHFIFCTEDAGKKHWEEFCREFEASNSLVPEKVTIPNGATEDELWEIFDIVRKKIPENAEIVFDVTHSFRSLPILMTILLNYLKELNGVSLKKCYYGAWEAKKDECRAPIFDLTPFFTLNDWAHAVTFYEKSGNVSEIKKLVENKGNFFQKNPSGSDVASDLKNMVKEAEKLTLCIGTCRMPRIAETKIAEKFTTLDEKVSQFIPPFAPIYAHLKSDFKEYLGEKVHKWGAAIRQCIRYGHIQQGYTLIQEVIISSILSELEEGLEKKNDSEGKRFLDSLRGIRKREFVRDLIRHKNDNVKKIREQYPETYKNITDIIETALPDFSETMSDICNLRNDINHAGMGSTSYSPEELRDMLKKYWRRTEESIRNGIKKSKK